MAEASHVSYNELSFQQRAEVFTSYVKDIILKRAEAIKRMLREVLTMPKPEFARIAVDVGYYLKDHERHMEDTWLQKKLLKEAAQLREKGPIKDPGLAATISELEALPDLFSYQMEFRALVGIPIENVQSFLKRGHENQKSA